ncbi:DUF4158 domain-containing protein [Sphingomonas faeni]
MPARIPMTERQRAALLALPDTETMVVRHHGLDAEDMSAIGIARPPATRLSYALQLCCLRYPGRHLRAGELLPAIMLDHIADQVGVDAGVIADFARRTPTRYDQLAAIKARFGFTDLSQPVRTSMTAWLATEAMPIVDGRILLDRLLGELRTRRIVIPGISVVERMAAEAMLRAETDLVAAVDDTLDTEIRQRLDTLVDDKVHDRQSRFFWLREPEPRVASASLAEILEKVALIRWTGISRVPIDPRHEPRLTQFAREGVRYTAQAFQQMRPARRRVILLATLRELEATLTDAAIAMFGALRGRAHLRARKRLEQRITVSGREGRDRLMRIATVLETVSRAARAGEDIGAALRNIMPLDFHGRAGTAALRSAMTILPALDGDWRKPLPADVPLGHVERRWHRHVVVAGKIDRTHWEMATYGALANALASGDIWVPTSRMHRSLDVLLAPSPGATLQPPFSLGDAHAWLDQRAEQLDSALRGVARNLDGRDAALFVGERLRFPKEKDDDAGQDERAAPDACLLRHAACHAHHRRAVASRTLDRLHPAFRSCFNRIAAC